MRWARPTGPALVGLVMVAALLGGPGAASGTPATSAAGSAPSTSAERPAQRLLLWSGYRIDHTGKASGGWIGARRRGDHGPVLYLIDPATSARPTTYRGGRWVHRLRGKGVRFAAGRRATSRAAWIVSKYGTYRYDVQSAAVDAALLHLLARHRWTLGGELGARRIRQSADPAKVRKFARTMIDDSSRRAGPYSVQVRQRNVAVVGDPVRLMIRAVVARNGRPLPYVPVRVRTPDGTTDAGLTGEDGRVELTYDGVAPGETPLRVTVGKAPETRLRVLSPRRERASRVVIAGKKGTVRASDAMYVKARPRVAVTALDKKIRTDGGARARFDLVESAEDWPRAAAVSVHGPFEHGENVRCGTRRVRTGTVEVAGDGTYTTPRFTLGRKGYYIWRVRVPGDRVNLAAADCDGLFRVVGKG